MTWLTVFNYNALERNSTIQYMSTLRHTSISDASKGTLIMGGNAILDPTRFVTQSLNGNEPVPDGDTNDVCRQRHHSRTTQSERTTRIVSEPSPRQQLWESIRLHQTQLPTMMNKEWSYPITSIIMSVRKSTMVSFASLRGKTAQDCFTGFFRFPVRTLTEPTLPESPLEATKGTTTSVCRSWQDQLLRLGFRPLFPNSFLHLN